MVRLKGGDPFLFGRGGEEAEALAAAGIRFEVVPGVSAGIAVPAYAGIPLTHRGVAAEVVFLTGHDSAESPSPVDWARYAASKATLVVFMGHAAWRDCPTAGRTRPRCPLSRGGHRARHHRRAADCRRSS